MCARNLRMSLAGSNDFSPVFHRLNRPLLSYRTCIRPKNTFGMRRTKGMSRMGGMPSMRRWNDFQTLKFIRAYRAQELLWNFNHPLYNDKESREQAILKMRKALDLPEFMDNDISQIKKKIRSLRTTYTHEILKMSDDKTYQPTLVWFDEADKFMRGIVGRKSYNVNQIHARQLEENEKKEASSSHLSDNEDEDIFLPPDNVDEKDFLLPDNEDKKDSLSPDNEDKNDFHPTNNEDENSSHPTNEDKDECNDNNAKRKKMNDTASYVSSVVEKLLSNGMKNLQSDEFDHFGANVASQLRELPKFIALGIQSQILCLIMDARIEHHNLIKPQQPVSVEKTRVVEPEVQSKTEKDHCIDQNSTDTFHPGSTNKLDERKKLMAEKRSWNFS